MGAYQILHPGFGRYHHIGLIVPLLAALSPMLLSRLAFEGLPQSINALIAGTLIFALTYILMTVVPGLNNEVQPLGKAILLGLLVAEFMVFSASLKMPSIVNITFYLFMYFYGLADLVEPF